MLHFKKILVIFLLVLTGMSAHAQQKEQRIALVIGNSAYRNTAPLKNPVNDATDMAQVLREKGFQVTVRTNLEVKEMRQVIRSFSQALKAGGVGLFYFAGHGIQSKGRNYLIPTNADVKEEYELEDEAIDANRVLDGMEAAGNRVNIVILDACRDNPYARSWRGGSRGLAQLSAPIGSFVAFATAPGSVAADGSGRNGVFTQHLLTSLRHPDTDIDKVFTRVTAAVSKESGNKQVPWKSSSLTGEFLFSQQQPTMQASVSSAPQLTESQLVNKLLDTAKAKVNKNVYEDQTINLVCEGQITNEYLVIGRSNQPEPYVGPKTVNYHFLDGKLMAAEKYPIEKVYSFMWCTWSQGEISCKYPDLQGDCERAYKKGVVQKELSYCRNTLKINRFNGAASEEEWIYSKNSPPFGETIFGKTFKGKCDVITQQKF